MQAGRRLGMLVATGLAFGMAAAPAGADPKGELIPLDCEGTSYTIAVNGNGDFTPGHDVASTSMLVPVAFGPFTSTVTDSEGNVVDRETEPGAGKGQSGKNARDLVTCTFRFSGTFTENGETFTFTGSGSVTGFITPRGRR